MWEWIQTLTFFNWLTLVGFIFASISVTNAFFSLKSRFKSWFAIRSKEALRNRLLELERLARNTKRHTNEPTTLVIDLSWEATNVLLILCITFIIEVFIISVLIINKVSTEYIFVILFATLIHFPSEIIRYLQLVRQKISHFYNPSLITKEAEKLIGAAKRLGLISDEEILTIQQMLEDKKLEDSNTLVTVDNS